MNCKCILKFKSGEIDLEKILHQPLQYELRLSESKCTTRQLKNCSKYCAEQFTNTVGFFDLTKKPNDSPVKSLGNLICNLTSSDAHTQPFESSKIEVAGAVQCFDGTQNGKLNHYTVKTGIVSLQQMECHHGDFYVREI